MTSGQRPITSATMSSTSVTRSGSGGAESAMHMPSRRPSLAASRATILCAKSRGAPQGCCNTVSHAAARARCFAAAADASSGGRSLAYTSI